MNRALVTCAACIAVAAGNGCKKRSVATAPPTAARVSVQQPAGGTSGASDWTNMVYPARYAAPELPVFPADAVAAAVAHATVRADFTVLPDGHAHDIRVELVEPVPEGELFVAACAAALEHWRFSPAWRLARENDPGDAPVVLLPWKAYLIFDFELVSHLEGGHVDLRFGSGGQ